MKCFVKKKKTILILAIVITIVSMVTIIELNERFHLIGDTSIPNLTMTIQNKSFERIVIKVIYDDDTVAKEEIIQEDTNVIKMTYRSNLENRLRLIVLDKDNRVLAEENPYLNIKRQHIYNPNIKYEVEVVFDGALSIEQKK